MDNKLSTTDRGELTTRPANTNPALVYLAGLTSAGSRRTMAQALASISALLQGVDLGTLSDGERQAFKARALDFPWSALRFQHTAMVRSALAAQHAPATASKMLCALRGVLKAAWRLEQMTAEDYQRAVDVEGVKGETLPAGRSLTSGEIAAMLDACANDPTPMGARDGAIVALAYSCGLRREELAALDLADFDPQTGALTIRHGKGNKARQVYAINGAADALADWLIVRGDRAGALFLPIRKGGHIQAGPMTTQAVWHILTTRARQAGVKKLSPHDFRRTFVGDLLDAGADISTVAKLAGHASVTTTQRYDRRPEAAKRKAVELLHVPYRSRRAL